MPHHILAGKNKNPPFWSEVIKNKASLPHLFLKKLAWETND